MPYNTRRKSLSLPSLGIHLPASSRAHRSPHKPTPTIAEVLSPPPKKVKRSHDNHAPTSPPSTSVSVRSPNRSSFSRPKSRRGGLEHTPPPSPGHSSFDAKVDTDGINDDIVIAVIEQLEGTGNRPHLIKELATVLAASNESVAHSANPAALLSSRLSLYLKRPWTVLSPCPLAKELIPVHPRKVFFYLTTTPHQKLPESSDDIITHISNDLKRLTPSISSPSVDQDDNDQDTRTRMQMSPSPEVDLSSPELDQDHAISPPTPGESFSGRSSVTRDAIIDKPLRIPHRAPSPPLEADEKGFTETASAVRARALSINEPAPQPSIEVVMEDASNVPPVVEETAEIRQKRDRELGYELFGHAHGALAALPSAHLLSSPMMPPKDGQQQAKKIINIVTDMAILDADLSKWELRSPEKVDLAELDGMFSGF